MDENEIPYEEYGDGEDYSHNRVGIIANVISDADKEEDGRYKFTCSRTSSFLSIARIRA